MRAAGTARWSTMSPRPLAALLAALAALALVAGPRAPGIGTGRPVRLETIRQAASLVQPDPSPEPTRAVPPAAVAPDPVAEAVAVATRAAAGVVSAPRGRLVALTFDDGPDSRWTPQVLALLARYHAHATFCVIGRQVRTRAALIRAIVAQGHTLCNHSWSHDEQLATRPASVIDRELAQTDAALRSAVPGVPVPWFRAPGGTWTPALTRLLARSAHAPLDWSVDPRDWDKPGAAAIVHSVLAGLRPGAVVDLHDGGGDRSQTVAALRVLLPALAARHYTCVPVTAAMAARTF
jgi:peptidoglycan-N-acetylglucosamine deacetylase